MTTRLRRLGRSPVVSYVLVVVVLFVGLALYQNNIRTDLRDAQRAGCERGKLDRADNARAFRAQSDYLNLVLEADSVKADVKRAARVNQAAQNASASSLEARTGDNLICAKAFP